MRILIPSVSFGDSFVDNVQDTLVQMGHEVRTLEHISQAYYASKIRRGWQFFSGALLGDRPGPVDRKIEKLAKEFRPDMVLSVTGRWHPGTLEVLRSCCPGRLVLWWGDPPANNQRWGILDPSWDFVFIKDAQAVSKLRLAGRNAFLLHEAINPKWHKPLASRENDAIAIAGNFYGFRQAMIVRLNSDKIPMELYGPRPPRWSHPEVIRLHSGRYIIREEKSRIFGRALACLNTFTLAEGNSLNCRAFEIAGAAGLQLIEYRPAIEQCFEPGKELLAFRTYEELLDHIARARQDPKGLQEIREAGAKRALAEHTYAHRLNEIFQKVG